MILLLFTITSYSQNEANNWYFGYNAGISFNTGSPVALDDGELLTSEGCATISDADGNLLFYTDGSVVFNRNHVIMPNGNGLLGNTSSTQSAIIVPKPLDDNIYYIFTTDYQISEDGLNYSVVDMTLDGGLGDLTSEKNILLLASATEKLTAVAHSNGQDFWVVSHEWNSQNFVSYHINENGIAPAVISAVGPFVGGESIGKLGAIKFSPLGNQIGISNANIGTSLFDFNNTTGVISNENVLSIRFGDYDIGFSPGLSALYVSSEASDDLYQYNLNAPDIPSSEIIVSTEGWKQFQIGPDQRLYAATQGDTNYVGIIENPEIIGLGCNPIVEGFFLGDGICSLGLPQFIQSYFQFGFGVQNFCLGEETLFSANIASAYDSLLWNFGDGTTSSDTSPSHTYLSAGDYEVTLTVTTSGQSVTESETITIFENPVALQPSNLSVCDTSGNGIVNFDLSQQISDILSGQSQGDFDVLFYSSLEDQANNNPIVDATSFTNTIAYGIETIYVTVQNNQNVSCNATTSFEIQVFASPPVVDTIAPILLCDNNTVGTYDDGLIIFDLTAIESTLLASGNIGNYNVFYYEDITNTIEIINPTNYQNTQSSQNIYIQVINAQDTSCFINDSFEIEVVALPEVNNIVNLSQCDDDIDGFSFFNLTEVIDEISINNATEIITFHESENEAIIDTNPITTATQYQNEIVSQDTVWARIENSSGCFRTSQINLEVSTTQIPLNFTRSFYQCDDAINGTINDGVSSFDFSTVTQEITSIFPAGQQLIINYYRNIVDALSENNAILNISDYRNETSPFIENIYIRVDSAVNNDCLGLGEHITLNVETVPEAFNVVIDTLCDEDGDGLASFDTSQVASELLQGQNNIVVTYTDQNGAVLPSPLPNPFITGSQNVIATLTNSTSLDPNGACTDQTTLSFQVEAAAVANAIAIQRDCDDDEDGIFSFDTSTIESNVLNGQTGMTVSYIDQNGSILPSPLPNPLVTTTQDITVRVENQLSSDCYDETIISFIVDQQPQAFTIMDDFVCDDVSNNGEALFILSLYNSEILGSQSSGMFEILYFASADDAQDGIGQLPNTFVNTSNPQTIHARIQNVQNDNCFETTNFQIGVYELPIANEINDVNICDVDNDTFEIFDLSSLNGSIINGQSNTTVEYYNSASDANFAQNALDTIIELDGTTTQIYARLESTLSLDCYTVTSFTIHLREQPEINLDPVYFICDENPITLSVNGSYDIYEWSTGEFSTDITISEPGGYSITATNFYDDFECSETFQFQVLASGLPEILDVVVEDFTNSDNSISITVDGAGDYEFSLDFGNWQDENTFSNLEYQEIYNVFIRDKNGCGLIAQEVFLLNAPTYFTPNGDGINDVWNVYNFEKETSGVIHIFDRYGKQLSSIKAGTRGWDGVYNGQELPSTDYWFRLEKSDGRVHIGHFSLLR